MTLPVVNAIWIGKAMGPAHAACLSSFLRTDHQVVLHTYGEVADAPFGVRYADANSLMQEDQLIRHNATGSFSLVTNLMRYELLRRGLGLYVDCDVFCLRPMSDRESIFGWESRDYLNSAVLNLGPLPRRQQNHPPRSPICRGARSAPRRLRGTRRSILMRKWPSRSTSFTRSRTTGGNTFTIPI
jgi:hypothetical protein